MQKGVRQRNMLGRAVTAVAFLVTFAATSMASAAGAAAPTAAAKASPAGPASTPAVTEPGAVIPKLPYKQAKEMCLKDKPDLKGKPLRDCVKEKQRAAQ